MPRHPSHAEDIVDRADEDDRRAEIEDSRFYAQVSHRHGEFLILIDL
jgi:hypothetical protein